MSAKVKPQRKHAKGLLPPREMSLKGNRFACVAARSLCVSRPPAMQALVMLLALAGALTHSPASRRRHAGAPHSSTPRPAFRPPWASGLRRLAPSLLVRLWQAWLWRMRERPRQANLFGIRARLSGCALCRCHSSGSTLALQSGASQAAGQEGRAQSTDSAETALHYASRPQPHLPVDPLHSLPAHTPPLPLHT